MIAPLLRLSLFVAALIGCQPAWAQNSGLERLTRPDQIVSWKAVGRVDIGRSGFCTGTLIAPDLVLTAAHCLFDEQGKPRPVDTLMFRAGYADGVSIAESRVLRATAHESYDHRGDGKIEGKEIRYDVALLQLADPIQPTIAPPFSVERPGNGTEVSVVSYARGRSEALSWQRNCTVLGRQAGLIAVDCDVTFGSSGAPVFDRSQGRARIVSLISGGGTYNDGVVAFGMELPSLVSDLKAQLWADRSVIGAPTKPGASVRRIAVGSGERAGGARFLKAPGN
jgi:protease YdgD